MSRLSGHLSQVGALVVAVVAAAVAYSVYDAGSTTSKTDAREPVAGLLADSGDSLLSPDSDRQEKLKRVREPNVASTAGPSSAEAARSRGRPPVHRVRSASPCSRTSQPRSPMSQRRSLTARARYPRGRVRSMTAPSTANCTV